jgi:hypothetical protein
MHDFTNENDDNDDPLKNNSQVPTSINVIIYKSKPLNGVIQ